MAADGARQALHPECRGLRLLSISSIWSVLGFDSLSFKSRIRLILFLARAGAKIRGLNFFDLASAPEELDMDNAYAYARDQIGQDVAEYIVDGITTTYQFHRSSEISTTGMFALAGLTANSSEGFTMYHTIGEMRTIPCELAKRLDVRTKTQVSRIEPHKGKVAITATGKRMKFDTVVCASTGDRAREMLIKPSRKQAELLASVRYASSINISYKIPVEVLSGISAVTVPHIENPSISGYTNESLKGICVDGKTLINVYLHEGWARKMMKKSEKEIFTQVKGELVKVCPPLDGRKELLEDHEIQRWPSAMPKFDHKYVTRVKRFWQDGQGDNGVYLCGDYLNTPWVEGASHAEKKWRP